MAKKPDKNTPPVRERPPNPDDQWVDELRTSCARAMGQHLKGSVNLMRPISSLTRPELEALAEACTAHWIVAVSKKKADEALSPTLREFKQLLLG